MFVVCKEHVELAIEMFVDEYEEAPDLYALDEVTFTDWTPPACCDRCANKPQFLVI